MVNASAPLIAITMLTAVFFWKFALAWGKVSGSFGDLVLHYYPLKHMAAENIIAGKMPLWNPYIFTGQPFIANPQSSVFYPFGLVFNIFPVGASFNAFIVMHIILGGYFFYLLLKSKKLANSSSMLGALSFAFSGFMLYRIPAGHPIELAGYAWLPAAVMFIDRIDGKNAHTTVVFALSLALAYQAVSGHVYAIMCSFVYASVAVISRRLGNWKQMLAAFVACGLISSVQLIPTMELSKAVENMTWVKLAENYSLPLKNLINIILPDFYGNALKGDYVHQSSPSFFFEKHGLYYGLAAFMFFAWGTVKVKTGRIRYLAVIAIALLLSTGYKNPFVRPLFENIQFLEFIRVPARFYVLAMVCMTVIAACCFDAVMRRKNTFVKALILMFVFADLYAHNHGCVYVQDISALRSRSVINDVVSPMYRLATEPDLLMANKSMLNHQYNLNGYEALMLMDFTRYLGLREKEAMYPTGLARIDLDSVLARGLSARYKVTPKNYANDKLLAEYPGGLKVYENRKYLPRIYFAKNIVNVDMKDPYAVINHLRKTAKTPKEELLVADSGDFIVRSGAEPSVIKAKFSQEKIEVDAVAPQDSVLVCSDVFFGGWKAASGKRQLKMTRGNKVFRAVFLEKGLYSGVNRIIIYYDPSSWKAGLYLTLILLISIAVLAVKRSVNVT
ncbi:MAG: hypothetical protein JW803_03310 [Endomicrobiales bacterium]|nr:hypothetical protein [Endomicrobiales bacterium]